VLSCHPCSEQLAQLLPLISSGAGGFGINTGRFPSTPAELSAARQGMSAMQRQISDPAQLDRGRVIWIPGPEGDIGMRIIEPARAAVAGAVLHIHGGGWVFGCAADTDPLLGPLVDKLNIVTASIDYRLAPEQPYPAATDDCETAALWWVEYCRRHYGVERVVIAGESAGAHLAAVTTLRMRHRHDYRFAGANLVYGLYDFGNGLPSRTLMDGRNLIQDSRSCAYYAESFVPNVAMRAAADVSPLRAGPDALQDLPPALFTVGSQDPFYDDSVLMQHRWMAAGNEAWLQVYQQAPHGFMMLAVPESAHLARLGEHFLRYCLEL
jgi:acetyl esterase